MILPTEEIQDKLVKLNGWSYENNSIQKTYVLNDFVSVLAFVLKVGIEAEKMNHHPDILMYAWKKCKITISTHSEGGVTEKDFNLAHSVELI